ncbi:hypothetical protein Thimo_2259 [Thioflavicoccus mobilis 8321]|uniref:Uncharacterized protein n=1 Tax=Thioflavicoccus mobilis 8321 TaxID=765912 RepID=L0H067_9GAMM|nr:hypothetical protein [Thioflavicoccus mobilis]AGA91005.1 hypothetical protein Thimo_2259 [Thioflavicoccus mobilis 8321]
MDKSIIKANFRTIDFDNKKKLNSVLFYGCVRNSLRTHTYFIVDLWNSKCHVVELNNLYTLRNFYKCLTIVARNNHKQYESFRLLRTLLQDSTYTIKQYGLLVGANIPHHVRYIGGRRFWVGNVGTHNALICDLDKRQVTSVVPAEEDVLLGPQVSYDAKTGEVFFVTYEVKGHLQMSLVDPQFKNRFSIKKWNQETGEITTVWTDEINCLLLDGFRVTADQSYAIFSDLRFALDDECQFDPNSIYVVDLKTKKTWEIPGLKASAHVEPDPDDPNVFYVSEHQIGIVVRDQVTEEDVAKNKDVTLIAKLKFVTKEIGGVVGVASILKYRMTPEGPELLGRYSDGQNFVRATWHFAFKNKGRKYIATISSPYIMIIDAETMTLYKKIDTGIKPLYGLQVSEDGEQFYCNSFFDFYIVDFDTGEVQTSCNFQKRREGRVFHVSAHTIRADNFW